MERHLVKCMRMSSVMSVSICEILIGPRRSACGVLSHRKVLYYLFVVWHIHIYLQYIWLCDSCDAALYYFVNKKFAFVGKVLLKHWHYGETWLEKDWNGSLTLCASTFHQICTNFNLGFFQFLNSKLRLGQNPILITNQ